MTVTIVQPKNSEGKSVPLCAFDAQDGRYGHEFRNMTPGETAIVDGVTAPVTVIVCVRCGAMWRLV